MSVAYQGQIPQNMPDAAAVPGANDWTGVIGGSFIWTQVSSFLALLLNVEWE